MGNNVDKKKQTNQQNIIPPRRIKTFNTALEPIQEVQEIGTPTNKSQNLGQRCLSSKCILDSNSGTRHVKNKKTTSKAGNIVKCVKLKSNSVKFHNKCLEDREFEKLYLKNKPITGYLSNYIQPENPLISNPISSANDEFYSTLKEQKQNYFSDQNSFTRSTADFSLKSPKKSPVSSRSPKPRKRIISHVDFCEENSPQIKAYGQLANPLRKKQVIITRLPPNYPLHLNMTSNIKSQNAILSPKLKIRILPKKNIKELGENDIKPLMEILRYPTGGLYTTKSQCPIHEKSKTIDFRELDNSKTKGRLKLLSKYFNGKNEPFHKVHE